MSTRPKTTTVATGMDSPAVGLGEDLTSVFRNALSGQANAVGGGGIEGFINELFSAGAGNLGGSLDEIINRDIERSANELRSQFGSSFAGSAFGTPGAIAESRFREGAAPQAALGIGNLQLNALAQMLPQIAGLAGMGIPQAQETVIAQPSTFQQVTGGLADLAGAFFGGPLGKGLSDKIFGRGGNNQPTTGSAAGQSGAVPSVRDLIPQGFNLPNFRGPQLSF